MARPRQNPDRSDGRLLGYFKVSQDIKQRYDDIYYKLKQQDHALTKLMFFELVVEQGLNNLE